MKPRTVNLLLSLLIVSAACANPMIATRREPMTNIAFDEVSYDGVEDQLSADGWYLPGRFVTEPEVQAFRYDDNGLEWLFFYLSDFTEARVERIEYSYTITELCVEPTDPAEVLLDRFVWLLDYYEYLFTDADITEEPYLTAFWDVHGIEGLLELGETELTFSMLIPEK
ncbi:hypothetical protein K8R78_00080 [bacterium]|nr:hypothetical protein [bacterium]